MTITIISVGAPPKPEIKTLIQNYSKRLPSSIKLDWVYIRHAKFDPKTSINYESEKILRVLPKMNKVILLDERGAHLSSPNFSDLLYADSQNKTIIIGGAYGVNSSVRNKADTVISLSKLVFPHQIVRLILTEQIYRAHTIKVGHPYHHK